MVLHLLLLLTLSLGTVDVHGGDGDLFGKEFQRYLESKTKSLVDADSDKTSAALSNFLGKKLCPNLKCDPCHYGYQLVSKKDSDGCPMCGGCKSCSQHCICSYGFVEMERTNEFGCTQCACVPCEHAKTHHCSLTCSKDEIRQVVKHKTSGCDICECIPKCRKSCPIDDQHDSCKAKHGRIHTITDTKGCVKECKCVTPDDGAAARPNPKCPPCKPRLDCGIHGYKLDKNQCPMCMVCDCPESTCDAPCNKGFYKEMVRDRIGCKECKCEACKPCEKTCSVGEFLQKTEENGCEKCKCQKCSKADAACPSCSFPTTAVTKKNKKGCPHCRCMFVCHKQCPSQNCPRGKIMKAKKNSDNCVISCKCEKKPCLATCPTVTKCSHHEEIVEVKNKEGCIIGCHCKPKDFSYASKKEQLVVCLRDKCPKLKECKKNEIIMAVRDSRGCVQRCFCEAKPKPKRKPKPKCPSPDCPVCVFPNGQKMSKDPAGCPICKCHFQCRKKCPKTCEEDEEVASVKDENGCIINCKCVKKRVCAQDCPTPLTCPANSLLTRVRDRQDCIVQCKCEDEVKCHKRCPEPLSCEDSEIKMAVHDRDNCIKRCFCRAPVKPTEDKCPELKCPECGFPGMKKMLKNADGCPACECAFVCRKSCPSSVECPKESILTAIRDYNGCVVNCDCVAKPKPLLRSSDTVCNRDCPQPISCAENEIIVASKDGECIKRCYCQKKPTEGVVCPKCRFKVDCGPWKHKFDENGCQSCTECQCEARCRRKCAPAFRKLYDKYGCPICDCEPCQNQRSYLCPSEEECPQGTEVVEAANGCQKCQCRKCQKTCAGIDTTSCPAGQLSTPTTFTADENCVLSCSCCAPDTCTNKCGPFPVKRDSKGCRIGCECDCPIIDKCSKCPAGSGSEVVKDEFGCSKCSCVPCPQSPKCPSQCPSGQEPALEELPLSNTCPRCTCLTCPAEPQCPVCSKLQIQEHYLENDCKRCRCKNCTGKPECPTCQQGFVPKEGREPSTGCRICACVPAPTTPAPPPTTSAPIPTSCHSCADITPCPSGWVAFSQQKDEDGCPLMCGCKACPKPGVQRCSRCLHDQRVDEDGCCICRCPHHHHHHHHHHTQLHHHHEQQHVDKEHQQTHHVQHHVEQQHHETHHDKQHVEQQTHHEQQHLEQQAHHEQHHVEQQTHHEQQHVEKQMHHEQHHVEQQTHHEQQHVEKQMHHEQQHVEQQTHHDQQHVEKQTHHAHHHQQQIEHEHQTQYQHVHHQHHHHQHHHHQVNYQHHQFVM